MDTMFNTEPIQINPNQSKSNVCYANLNQNMSLLQAVLDSIAILSNTFQSFHEVLERIGTYWQGFERSNLYWLVWSAGYTSYTNQYKPIHAQYLHDGDKTRGRWGFCIGMY